jgi:hypothetical protein
MNEFHLTSTAIFDTPVYKDNEILYKMKAVYNCSKEMVFYTEDINTLYQYQPKKTFTDFNPIVAIPLFFSSVIFALSILIPLFDWISEIKFPSIPKKNAMWFGILMVLTGALICIHYQSIPVQMIDKNIAIKSRLQNYGQKLIYEIKVNYEKDWVNYYYSDSLEKATAFQPDNIYYAPNTKQIMGLIVTLITGAISFTLALN